jgi:hypothetical protein
MGNNRDYLAGLGAMGMVTVEPYPGAPMSLIRMTSPAVISQVNNANDMRLLKNAGLWFVESTQGNFKCKNVSMQSTVYGSRHFIDAVESARQAVNGSVVLGVDKKQSVAVAQSNDVASLSKSPETTMIAAAPAPTPKAVPTRPLSAYEKQKQIWVDQMIKSRDPNRNELVLEVAARVSGIYKEKEVAKALKIENTILMNVISHLDKTNLYNELLTNWQCFTSYHGLQAVTYILPSPTKNFSTMVQDFRNMGIETEFLPYPEEQFWALVSKKSNGIVPGGGHCDYETLVPSFEHFGALVMLVPIYELVKLGHNVIYIDLDIGFVQVGTSMGYLFSCKGNFLDLGNNTLRRRSGHEHDRVSLSCCHSPFRIRSRT